MPTRRTRSAMRRAYASGAEAPAQRVAEELRDDRQAVAEGYDAPATGQMARGATSGSPKRHPKAGRTTGADGQRNVGERMEKAGQKKMTSRGGRRGKLPREKHVGLYSRTTLLFGTEF